MSLRSRDEELARRSGAQRRHAVDGRPRGVPSRSGSGGHSLARWLIETSTPRSSSTSRLPIPCKLAQCSSCHRRSGGTTSSDLRPGRSFVEYAVNRGLPTFVLSWRNPTKHEGDWDLDNYAGRVLSAIDTVREITGSRGRGPRRLLCRRHSANLGAQPPGCPEGLSACTASFAVTLLDFGQAAPIRAFSSPRLLALARWNSQRTGVISARNMGNVFTWMRPNEAGLELLGEQLPDGKQAASVRHPRVERGRHATCRPGCTASSWTSSERNVLCRPGEMTVLGTPVDLATITTPTFVTGGTTDHLTPWTGCSSDDAAVSAVRARSSSAMRGTSRVWSTRPATRRRLSSPAAPPVDDPQAWLDAADKHAGTWWEHWADWVIERSDGTVPAPDRLGSADHPAREEAPGLYVRDLVPAGRLTDEATRFWSPTMTACTHRACAAAAEAVTDLGDLLIVAPATQQTSMSRAFVTGDDIGAISRHDLHVAGRNVAGLLGGRVAGRRGDTRAAGIGGPDTGSMHQWHQLRRECRRRARGERHGLGGAGGGGSRRPWSRGIGPGRRCVLANLRRPRLERGPALHPSACPPGAGRWPAS